MNLKPWKVNPDFIPQQDFHKGYWLSVNEPNPWYYFFPADRSFKLPSNPKFYETVDKDQVETVKLLHNRGIPTTPSCTGHFYDSDHYAKIYKKLESNAKKIVSEGIILQNSETGTKYFYRNNRYRLPWDVEFFVSKSLEYQIIGVLGFLDFDKKLISPLDPRFETQHEKGITLVFERSDNQKDKSSKWNELCEVLNDYLLL